MPEKSDDRSLMVEFTAEGQVRPSVRAAERLGRRKGLWRLVPEVGRVMLLERVGGGEEASERTIRLAGTFDSSGEFHNVLSMIAMGQQDGAMHVTCGDHHKVLYFRNGVLLSARSSLPEDRLGNLLVRVGLLKAEDLDRCLPEIRQGQPLGTVLVAQGIMTTSGVYDALRRQTEEIFFSMLGWEQGSFYLVSPLDTEEVPAMLHLNTTELLMDGVRRLDEGEGTDPFESENTGLRRIDPVPASTLPQRGPELIVETYNEALRGLFSSVGTEAAAGLRDSVRGFIRDALPFQELFFGVEVLDGGALDADALASNIGSDRSESVIHNMQVGLSEILFFALFAAGEGVTPELEARIQSEVALKLKSLPKLEATASGEIRSRGRLPGRDPSAPRVSSDIAQTAPVDLSSFAAREDVRGPRQGAVPPPVPVPTLDDELVAEIFEEDAIEDSVIAAVVEEDEPEIFIERGDAVPQAVTGQEASEPILLGAAGNLPQASAEGSVTAPLAPPPEDFEEFSLENDEEIMSLLDKVAEAQAEEMAARSQAGLLPQRSPSAEFDRLIDGDEDEDVSAKAADEGAG